MREPLTPEQEWKYAQAAMNWHGWGSPIGLGIFLISLSIAAYVVRMALHAV
ncbi:MAG: hypothetical protein JSR72_09145 [Proteobacteria bacterium]|nr:hypothetical protein [Pseudomonadota bacterium]